VRSAGNGPASGASSLAGHTILAAGARLAADRAEAAVSAQVVVTTLVVTGDAGPDRIALRPQAGAPAHGRRGPETILGQRR
jgi:hypothetical protein